jgi:peptide/nickel transport system substrate-binding protein
MKARRFVGAVALVAVLVTAAGCGGGSSGGGGGGNSNQVKQGGIFTIGTTNYIDTLNPFNYIESQAVTAYTEVYPSLVQYGPGLKEIVPDYATSWSSSSDGLTWTFKLAPGGKWSDGQPLTANDAVWTIDTILKYKSGPTAVLASALTHVASAEAPDDNTLIVHYDKAVGNALPQIAGLYVLPQHVWQSHVGNDGKDLKAFHPEQSLPLVSGGPFQITQYEKKGTTVFKPNPGFFGPKPHVDAVALAYYTNSDSMIQDLSTGAVNAVDQVPFTDVAPVKKIAGVALDTYPGAEITNITWNSNPLKPKNRELLDPKVKEALSMCVDRDELIDVVFRGYATKTESLLGDIAKPWQSTDYQPLQHDCAAANSTLDSLGYTKGADGIRVAPATTGKDAQPAHKMEYQIMVPGSLDFNGDRAFAIVQKGFAEAGVKVTEQSGGDSTASYAIETGNDCDAAKLTGYDTFDIALWDWIVYVDPDFQLSVVTRSQWCSWSDTGWYNADYDKLYDQQGTTVNEADRKTLVHQMDKIIHDNWLYTQLVNEQGIAAHSDKWGGFDPQLGGYNYGYMSDPYQK